MIVTNLLELFNGTSVNTTALVDQVTGGGGLAGVDVSDDDDVDVSALVLTVEREQSSQYDENTLPKETGRWTHPMVKVVCVL
jgi:hypothetical protein